MRYIPFIFAAALLAVPYAAPSAQERTASGNLQNEASWASLKSLVEAASYKAQGASALATAIKDCGVKGMVYAPGTAGIDAQGCKIPGGSAQCNLMYRFRDKTSGSSPAWQTTGWSNSTGWTYGPWSNSGWQSSKPCEEGHSPCGIQMAIMCR